MKEFNILLVAALLVMISFVSEGKLHKIAHQQKIVFTKSCP